MTSKNNPVCRFENLVVQEMDDEVLIYDMQTNKAYCLNETAAMVWSMCDGNNSITEINRRMETKLKNPFSEAVVWLALDQLGKNKLLIDNGIINAKFDGLGRRELIRKIGLASMITLPVISSLIAPQAVSAQSPGAICTAPAMGTTGAMFGTCLDVSQTVCQSSCNGGFNAPVLPIICCTGMANAVSCVPSTGGNVLCQCVCT